MKQISLALIITGLIVGTGIILFSPITPHVFSQTQTNNFKLSEFLYTSTPPILDDNATERVCDFWGNNCTWQPVSMDDRLQHFNDWCYSIMNTYTSGKTSQTFRTVSIDCFNYVMDQKLKPLNDKIDNLTAQIAILNAKLGK